MKILKSIKWRLQLWYGLILVVVLAGFGLTAYQLERNRQFRQVDEQLHYRLNLLAKELHHPPRGQDANRPPPGQPPRDQGFEGAPFDRPPQDRFPEDGPPQRDQHRPDFHLPDEDAHLFDASDPHSFYFIIRRDGGDEVARSINQPARAEVIYDHYFNQVNHYDLPQNRSLPPKVMNFEIYRDVVELMPSGETILVGCSIAPELKELRLTALKLTSVGGIILLLGLAGGGWLVSRAIKPIEAISATAVKISAGDLSQRINVAEAESELGQLAAVLNSTFARLETAFAQQKQFASDAAHELRTPVSVILTQTQTALQRERDAASYRQTVEACQRAAQRMRKLIESLLALARFDAGQEVLDRQPFDLARTIADSVELVQPLADERGVKLTVTAAPLEITADAGRLAQVVTNLLTNAIQYNQPEGEVRVTLAAEGGLAVLTIADTGQGIAAADLPRVFGRFYRADSSRTGAGNAGLGLAITKAIVEAHGGTIEVASGENVGTTFTVRLPANVES
jgi:heavy metal sensor kinase